jgi:hypothetical protein
MLSLFQRHSLASSRLLPLSFASFSKKSNDKIKPLAKAKTAAWEKPSGASLSQKKIN